MHPRTLTRAFAVALLLVSSAANAGRVWKDRGNKMKSNKKKGAVAYKAWLPQWTRHLASLALVAVLAAAPFGVASGAVIFASYNPSLKSDCKQRGVSCTFGVLGVSVGGRFDMHAGAQIGTGPLSTQVFHVPGQPAALANFFPTQQGSMASELRIDKNQNVTRQKQEEIRGGSVTARTPRVAYTTTPKDFERTIPIATNTAFRNGINPATGDTSTAEARARAQFFLLPILNSALVVADLRGTFSEYVRNAAPAKQSTAPDGKAGTLIRDPLVWGNLPAETSLSHVFGLDAADFRVRNDDHGGVASMSMQLGTDAFGSSPGNLGFDDEGNPLLLQLDLAFLSSGDVFLRFQSDNSFGQRFFDPESNDAPISDVGLFIAQRLASALVFDALTSAWTLSRNVALLGEAFDVPASRSDVDVDYIVAVQVSPVPEPSTLVLLAAGLGGLLALRRRPAIPGQNPS
ncbi:MAG TPA: PEP-CTERM sorting domain-containing protein [Burkholderiaceae bacterium]|nr:PEP-CTERM sorting domain-containing protein [Burkholderiaceae bacterium]